MSTVAVIEPQIADSSALTELSVEVVDTAWGFTCLRPRWNELLHDSDADNPFLTWDWLHAWWAHLRGTSGLRIVVVRSGEKLVAIAPFCLATAPLYWFSRLEFMGGGYAGSDYLDLIIRRGYERESVDAIAGYLKTEKLSVRLNHLPPTSFAARLADELAQDGWSTTDAADGMCPVIPLAGHTFDSYLGTLGSSHRANVRRRLKAMGQQFDMRFERVTSAGERREMLAALSRFHDRRYSDRGGSTAFSTQEVRAFHDEVTRRAHERAWLRMYVLRLNGEIAAVMYGFFYGGRFFFYQHGYDEKYKANSVGLVLMALTVRAAIEEGAREFDMLWGVEPYKFLWARDSRTLRRVELFPVHFGGTLHRHAIEARRGVSQLARRVLALRPSGVTRGPQS
jgi:CelD/BcsL family acetyltransferase involved in cellulose biosynthesis